jgi:glutamyl-tRNA synthetase
MKNLNIRTRFAPSPSGIMHIGNLRSALMNFLCAREMNGSFIIRIEDTDQKRTSDLFLTRIYTILEKMNILWDEGGAKNGAYGPYTQSQRTHIYQKYLSLFKEKNAIYRCFKTETELQEEREKQILSRQAPRYQRNIITAEKESELLRSATPYVWRLQLLPQKTIIQDKEKGQFEYDLSHFADCPLTRNDGSFTFLFANFVDDVEMKISYVIRGEEHLSNTAIQSYMYDILNIDKPLYYHLPLLCDKEGKKLSKRNFGFNVENLLEEGYLPEAIINYIAIIGGSFEKEILSLDEMIEFKLFTHSHSKGFITYDPVKLLWINSKWMTRLTFEEFHKNFIYFLKAKNEKNVWLNKENILANQNLINDIRKESKTLLDFYHHYCSFFESNQLIVLSPKTASFVNFLLIAIKNCGKEGVASLLPLIKEYAKNNQTPEREYYLIVRKILCNQEDGLSMKTILNNISSKIFEEKIKKIIFE